jgi:hypothetical protein
MATQRTTPLSIDMDERKLAELILYIATKSESDPNFGTTRLFKALFNADWNHYIATSTTITGHDYIKGPYGPMPHRGDEILNALESERLLAVQRHSRRGYPQQKPIALRDANLDLFTAQEIATVDQVIEEQHGMTATRVSKWPHDAIMAWNAARDGERIPFETSWVVDRPLTSREIEHGYRLAAKL